MVSENQLCRFILSGGPGWCFVRIIFTLKTIAEEVLEDGFEPITLSYYDKHLFFLFVFVHDAWCTPSYQLYTGLCMHDSTALSKVFLVELGTFALLPNPVTAGESISSSGALPVHQRLL